MVRKKGCTIKIKISFQLVPFLHADKGSIQHYCSHTPLSHIPPWTHTHTFSSANTMWVNEAQPEGAVSNTYASGLIRGRRGMGVGVGLARRRARRHQKWKRGGVHLISAEWLRYVHETRLSGEIKLYSGSGLLQQRRAPLCRNLKLAVFSSGTVNI